MNVGSKSLSNNKAEIHWAQSILGKETNWLCTNKILQLKNSLHFQTYAEKVKFCNSANVM